MLLRDQNNIIQCHLIFIKVNKAVLLEKMENSLNKMNKLNYNNNNKTIISKEEKKNKLLNQIIIA